MPHAVRQDMRKAFEANSHGLASAVGHATQDRLSFLGEVPQEGRSAVNYL
jgi:hypothetical protein